MARKRKATIENEVIEDPQIEDIENDPEDLVELPPDGKDLTNREWTDLGDLEIALEGQLADIRERMTKLDERMQRKLVRLGKVKARLKDEDKRRNRAQKAKRSGG